MSDLAQNFEDLVFEPQSDFSGVPLELGKINLMLCKNEDVEPVVPSHGEYSLKYHADIISKIVNVFLEEDYVTLEVAKHRSDKSMQYSSDTKTALMEAAGMFDLIDKQQELEYFTKIDQGFELYESGVDLANLSPEQRQTMLDLVAARQIVYLTNLRLVLDIAKKFKSVTISDVDLIGYGNIGLSNAVDRFDVTKGNKFSTYATEWIRQAILRAVSDKSRLIRIPMHRHEKFRKVSRTIDDLVTKLGREVTDEEAEAATGVSRAEISALIIEGDYTLKSIDAKIGDENSNPLVDYLSQDDRDMEFFEKHTAHTALIKAILLKSKLDNRRKMVLGLRYGLDFGEKGDFEVTLRDGTTISFSEAKSRVEHLSDICFKDIANILGIHSQNVNDLEKSALQSLKRVANENHFVTDWEMSN